MSIARGIVRLTQGARSVTTSCARSQNAVVNPGYKQLKPVQERFNSEDGTLIFVKGGLLDSVLYKVTMAACVGAVIWDFKLYIELGLK